MLGLFRDLVSRPSLGCLMLNVMLLIDMKLPRIGMRLDMEQREDAYIQVVAGGVIS
jgi:hypothetical protein